MDRNVWIRPLVGAGVTLLGAIVTVLARALAKWITRSRNEPPGTESTDELTLKIVRHNKAGDVPDPEGGHQAHRGPRGSPRPKHRRSA